MAAAIREPLVSVVIPAYNEADRIRPGLEQILLHTEQTRLDCEVVLSDDGSTDGTAEVVRRTLQGRLPLQVLRQRVNQGKALAVRRGMLAARGRFVGYADADMSTPFAEVDRFLRALQGGADLALGSRALAGSDVQVRQPPPRALAGRLFGLYARLVLLPGVPDSQCGFKFFRREVAQDLFPRLKLTGWAFDAELLYLARRLGYRLVQIPVRWINDPQTKVAMMHAGLRMGWDVLRVPLLHRQLAPKGEAAGGQSDRG